MSGVHAEEVDTMTYNEGDGPLGMYQAFPKITEG